MIPYTKQSISKEDLRAVNEVLKKDLITRGPVVKEFEQTIAEYCGAKYAVAFNSGTSGLLAASYAGKLTPYDRLITSPNTFVGTLAGGYYRDAQPVFVDIDRKTGNMDLDLVKVASEYTSSRGRNVYLPVHFSGIPIDIQKIESMISDPDSIVIEDAAHALGSLYQDGSKVGCCQYSDMTVFSFHPSKSITCAEGGVVTTNNEEFFQRLLQFRDNGIVRDSTWPPGYYEVHDVTGNYHMSDIHAALGLSQFTKLSAFIQRRKELMQFYRELLKEEEAIQFLKVDDDDQVMYHLCVVQIDFSSLNLNREQVMTQLKEKGIQTQVHYIPLYRHPFFINNHRNFSDYFPEMEKYYSQCLSLPLYYDLTKKEVQQVVTALTGILRHG